VDICIVNTQRRGKPRHPSSNGPRADPGERPVVVLQRWIKKLAPSYVQTNN